MRRREYVTAVGSSVGALTATGIGQAQRRLERVLPADSDTAVRPGGELVFEAAATPGFDPPATEWWIDGDGAAEVAPAAPFWSYTHRTGNPTAHGQFDEPGTYEVVVAADGATASWRVTVADDAPAAPSATVTCDPGPAATITTRDELTVTATATDDSGVLERVFWQEGRNATYVDSVDISGADARVTYTTTAGDAIWFIGGYPMMAWVVCRDGRVSVARTEGPSIEAMRDVRITGTNAPVRAGEDLVVDAELEIDGDSTYHGFVEATLELIVGHDPTHVDSTTVEVFAGQTETVSLEFTTATVRNTQTFPVRVETRHTAAETDVTVIGTDDEGAGQLTVTNLSTNAPVTGGDWLEVTATLANTGEGPVSREVELVVGHDPTTVDSQQVALDAGETTTVSLGYETYPVVNDDEFPVRVRTGDDSASRSVLVYGRDRDGNGESGEARFSVSITGTNAPVDGGDWLEVTATVENLGDTAASHDVELVVGRSPEVVDSRTVGLPAGQTATVSLGYETYPVTNDDTFPVTVRSPHSSDTRTVTVRGTG
ncbi:CARDB domain-containing protein [Haloarchaeobius amylolyticus]|uniref:CARDB domain-containing protein n=1 Tax=Haloarchaeobius amylolyticus TaxID=1198296 RepID=A0ABD6BGP7_9EURY